MITVLVGSKNQAPRLVKQHNATHWISLLDRGDRQFLPPNFDHVNRLWLNCEDVLKPTDWGAPTKEQVQSILDWTENLTDATIVVNCFAGISRSTATALAILTQHHKCVNKASELLLEVRPFSCPNPVISQFADEILNLNGTLFNASESIAKKRIISILGDDE